MGFLSRLFGEYENQPEDNFSGGGSQCENEVIYVNGETVWLDEEAKGFLRRYEYYLEKAESGNPFAQFEIGKCLFEYGECFWYGLERKTEAVSWLQKAAEKGMPGAYTYLGRYYSEDRFGEINMEKGIRYLAKGAKLNDAEAFYRLGILFEKGDGVAQDVSKAVQFKERAAALGSVGAIEEMGCIYYEGKLVGQDRAKAFPYLKRSFERGETYYSYYLACCYMYGEGVGKDEKKAVRVLQEICNGKFCSHKEEAEDLLMYCYENGIGTEVDYYAAGEIRDMQRGFKKDLQNFGNSFH